MENMNKAISFILGLVVVVVFLAVVTGRLKLGNLSFLPTGTRKPTVTPTLIPTPTPFSTAFSPTGKGGTVTGTPNYRPYNNGTAAPTGSATTKGGVAQSIPSTGAPTLLLPLALSSLAGGILLKKKSK